MFARAGAIYAAANIASAAVPFLLLPLLTRVLGPSDYGRVVVFGLLVTGSLTIAGLSAHAAVGVAWFKRPRDEFPAFVGSALAVILASTAIMSFGIATIVTIVPRLGAGLSPAWAALAALTAGANIVVQARLVVWQSQQRPIANAALQVTASAVNVGFSLAAVLLLGWGDAGRNAGIAVSALVMATVAVIAFRVGGDMRWSPRAEHFTALAAFGAPLILHSLAGVMLATTDRWIVGARLGAGSLGVYGAAAQLGAVMTILADAFVKAYGPWLYARLRSDSPQDKHRAVGAIYAGIPSFFVAAMVIGFALTWASGAMLGPEYRMASGLLPWFMVGGAFSGVYVCTSVLYFYSGRTGLLASVTISAALTGVVATWLLVTNFGVRGAAMGYGATQAALALFTTLVAIKAFDLPWHQPIESLTIWSRETRRAFPSLIGRTEPTA